MREQVARRDFNREAGVTHFFKYFLPVVAVGIAFGSHAQTKVRVYPAPAGEPLSQRFVVRVEHLDSPVYVAHVRAITVVKTPEVQEVQTDGEASFTSFDMSAPVRVEVRCQEKVTSAKILPTSYGISPEFSGNRVTFLISKPQQLTLEINGDWNNSLHLFANPIETDVPKATDPDVIYFGPGVHTIDSLKVGSGKTVCLAGGAVVYGKVTPGHEHDPVISLDGSNIQLRGRGILDGSLHPKMLPLQRIC